ncbi:MAG: toll/interleukin-1 receptor domain-containing protein [Chloroflexota bacterium]
MSQIFISYSRKDSDCVYKVKDELDENNFSAWIDLEAVQITSDWLAEIEKAIEESVVFMLFWSANAKDSDYVQHEIRLAKQLQIEKKIKILTVMLDDTDLPVKHLQAYDMKTACSPTKIKSFVSSLPAEWRAFSYAKSLSEQHHTIIDDGYVSVLFAKNTECTAYIIGKKDKQLPKKPSNLVIALQFTGKAGADTLDPVLNSLPDDTQWVLYIQGPVSGEYHTLDNDNQLQWQMCSDFVVENIRAVGSQTKSHLHFFARTPNAPFGSVTVPFYRFWHMHFYNFVGTGYKPVIEIPRS